MFQKHRSFSEGKGHDQFDSVNMQSAEGLPELRPGLVKKIMRGPRARDLNTKGDGTIQGQVARVSGVKAQIRLGTQGRGVEGRGDL